MRYTKPTFLTSFNQSTSFIDNQIRVLPQSCHDQPHLPCKQLHWLLCNIFPTCFEILAAKKFMCSEMKNKSFDWLNRRRKFIFCELLSSWWLTWPPISHNLIVTFPFVIFLMLNPTVGIMSSLNEPDAITFTNVVFPAC